MRNATKLGLVLTVAMGLGACDEVTGPGGGGEVRLEAVGDGAAGGAMQSASGSGTAEGTVRFRARVYARTSAGEWVELTRRGAEQATVRAQGSGEAVVFATARTSATSYDRVRVQFEEVEANVVSLRLAVGSMLTGSVRVQSESGSPATVERPAPFTVQSGGSARLLIDLNSSAWLSRADARTHTVSRAEFENAVRVLVR